MNKENWILFCFTLIYSFCHFLSFQFDFFVYYLQRHYQIYLDNFVLTHLPSFFLGFSFLFLVFFKMISKINYLTTRKSNFWLFILFMGWVLLIGEDVSKALFTKNIFNFIFGYIHIYHKGEFRIHSNWSVCFFFLILIISLIKQKKMENKNGKIIL